MMKKNYKGVVLRRMPKDYAEEEIKTVAQVDEMYGLITAGFIDGTDADVVVNFVKVMNKEALVYFIDEYLDKVLLGLPRSYAKTILERFVSVQENFFKITDTEAFDTFFNYIDNFHKIYNRSGDLGIAIFNLVTDKKIRTNQLSKVFSNKVVCEGLVENERLFDCFYKVIGSNSLNFTDIFKTFEDICTNNAKYWEKYQQEYGIIYFAKAINTSFLLTDEFVVDHPELFNHKTYYATNFSGDVFFENNFTVDTFYAITDVEKEYQYLLTLPKYGRRRSNIDCIDSIISKISLFVCYLSEAPESWDKMTSILNSLTKLITEQTDFSEDSDFQNEYCSNINHDQILYLLMNLVRKGYPFSLSQELFSICSRYIKLGNGYTLRSSGMECIPEEFVDIMMISQHSDLGKLMPTARFAYEYIQRFNSTRGRIAVSLNLIKKMKDAGYKYLDLRYDISFLLPLTVYNSFEEYMELVKIAEEIMECDIYTAISVHTSWSTLKSKFFESNTFDERYLVWFKTLGFDSDDDGVLSQCAQSLIKNTEGDIHLDTLSYYEDFVNVLTCINPKANLIV